MESRRKRLSKLSGAMEIPGEVLTGLPKVSVVGNHELYLENFNGIIQYTSCRVRLSTPIGELIICGKGLVISHMTREELTLNGDIRVIEYSGEECL